MKNKEELIKILCKLEEIQVDLKEIKPLQERLASLERFRSYLFGVSAAALILIPIIIKLTI